MGKKDKTRFEKWFSLSHHQRHTGTKKLSLLISSDFKSQKTKILLGNEVVYTCGTSVFKFGADDALENMRWHLNKVAKINIASEILLEIFKRLQKFDTIYKHTKKQAYSRQNRLMVSGFA